MDGDYSAKQKLETIMSQYIIKLLFEENFQLFFQKLVMIIQLLATMYGKVEFL